MRLFVLRVYLVFCFAIFITAMLLAYPFVLLAQRLPGERGRRWAHAGLVFWGSSFWLMGIRFTSEGAEGLPREGALLMVSNHESLLDSPAVYLPTRRRFRTLGKAELARLPVFGTLYKVACIVVDRTHTGSRTASLAAIMRGFGGGEAVLVFPEGRMNPEPGTLQPFQEASFAVAQRMGVPIQPIVVIGSGRLLPGTGPLLIRPGHIHTHFCPPVLPAEYQGLTPAALTALVRERMEATLAHYRSYPHHA